MNYQKCLDAVIAGLKENKPRLLLHSCCAPCSSYCLEYLREYFQITVFYYNPNITENEEYEKRKAEELRLIEAYNSLPGNRIEHLDAPYDPEKFLQMAEPLKDEPEGGIRCKGCFSLRLNTTALAAKEGAYDYFTTTLTISPLKNADLLNTIGESIGKKVGVPFLPSDFKKKGGYLRSIELSKEYNLYRQDYCGCVYSKLERERKKNETVSGFVIGRDGKSV